MKRRNFLRASLLSTSLASLLPFTSRAAAGSEDQKKSSQEFYELREYTFKNRDQQKLVEAFYKDAAIPAFNRLGIKPVGVFREQILKEQSPEGQPKLYVLIPYKTADQFTQVLEKLGKDVAYKKAGAAYLTAPATAPAYERIQSSLMKAFAYMPKLEVPEKKQRMFELRRYESHSETAGKKKIEMFNEGGELAIFRRVGLDPVFFGETIIGEKLPNLTYMITFDDMAEHDRNWKLFGEDPEWNRIKDLPEYADTVSNISRTYLEPTDFSQI